MVPSQGIRRMRKCGTFIPVPVAEIGYVNLRERDTKEARNQLLLVMTLTRNQFFLLLFLLIAVPFLGERFLWLARSRKAEGVMAFISHGDIGSAMGMTTYSVIDFPANNQRYSVKSKLNLNLKEGQTIPVRYQPSNPDDAIVDDFYNIWMWTIAYSAFPLLILLGIYLLPDRLDSPFPRNQTMLIGGRPFFRLQPAV